MDCRQIRFSDRKSAVDLRQLQQLLKTTAFWARNRSLKDLRVAVVNSNPVVTAWSGEGLVGFVRATSDGIYRATIWDVVVHPDFQGGGLGSKLIERIFEHPRLNRVERVYLMTTHQQAFYEQLGFRQNESATMVSYYKQILEHTHVAAVG